jgi:hypothetical protein
MYVVHARPVRTGNTPYPATIAYYSATNARNFVAEITRDSHDLFHDSSSKKIR